MIGIGGSTIKAELAAIQPTAHLAKPIQKEEFKQRIKNACKLMEEQNVPAMYLNAGVNLFYFTGFQWNASERMVGAVLFSNGKLIYIAPEFEKGTIFDFMLIEGSVRGWEEHKSPHQLFITLLKENGVASGDVFIDEATPFFVFDGIRNCQDSYQFINAKPITAGCRMLKSDAEIAIMQHAMNITLEVQKATARILRVGISAKEVTDFINDAHIKYGATSGSYFCIVLFGVDSSFPHGVKSPKNLEEDEVVLIDTGCMLHNYISDITRTYVFGKANEEQTRIWNIEKETQLGGFNASKLGNTCADVDNAARVVLEAYGLGPDYKLPGLPHRTGHGIGLEIHEWPYVIRNDQTVLKPGLAFSNEPMICVPGKFGIRLEDHIYMTNDGPVWFTEPSYSIQNPFGIE
ncbi:MULTISPECIES: M24 family metallopeptidase [unclassified Polaribacter]|uniref:M24 family metallopeptidase n=1 Tax=unclassified Polaribacter TaxID=196858 RepID=UPI0011BEAA4E|nr:MULTISPECIES: Xaa-Pro peptidase family protein [unclassified Polaribacter]TXD53284.1 aminopeptidase P family protein [Polaribacter sp. IC063]TXD60263.1 aminopeptidase P family protein [Polaribacter sp. IC066]